MLYDSKRKIVIRESWKEYFCFFVSNGIRADEFGGWYIRFFGTHEDYLRDGRIFYVFPLWFLVKVKLLWFDLARLCYKQGLFRSFPPVGEKVSYLWPKYFFK